MGSSPSGRRLPGTGQASGYHAQQMASPTGWETAASGRASAVRPRCRAHGDSDAQPGSWSMRLPPPLRAGQPVTSWERIPGVTPDEKLVHHTRRAIWATERTRLSHGSGAAAHSSECVSRQQPGRQRGAPPTGCRCQPAGQVWGVSRRHPACLGRMAQPRLARLLAAHRSGQLEREKLSFIRRASVRWATAPAAARNHANPG